jgi:hypothetical protein
MVTMRLLNSMREWYCSGGVRRPFEHVGQSEHPSPEPVRRTAAPDSRIAATQTRETIEMRRTVDGGRRDRCLLGASVATGERTSSDGSGGVRSCPGGPYAFALDGGGVLRGRCHVLSLRVTPSER